MSDAPSYDPVELRRRIVVCFTIGELRELADQLGVGGIAWERGIQEAAREVVKQCERYAGLPALVAKLREIRPLVEWPEAAGAAPLPPVGPFPPAPPLPEPSGFAPVDGARARPEGRDAAAAPAAPIADPFAAGAAPAPPHAPSPLAAPAPPAAAPAPPRLVASPVWPAAAPAPSPSRGVDPRILVAVAGIMLLAAIVAYLAGRASNGATTAAAPAKEAAPEKPMGAAALADAALARSFANLARTCELPPSSAGGELVFSRVFERCGPPPAPRPRAEPAPEPPPAPSADAEEPAAEPRARPRRPGRNGDAQPAEAPAQSATGCTGACDGQHRACKARCGPEPTESSGYQGFQLCLARCLSEASRCRLSCR